MSRNMRLKKQTVNTGSAKKELLASGTGQTHKEEDERHRRKCFPWCKRRDLRKNIHQKVSVKNKPT